MHAVAICYTALQCDMEQPRNAATSRFKDWTPVSEEPDHPLAAIDGVEFAGGRLKVLFGRTSRFGARYFALLFVGNDGAMSREPLLSGLHNSGPLPSYNWIEVAETNSRIALSNGETLEIAPESAEALLRLLFDVIPLGGHLMVEYDSPQRSETAHALTRGVPALASPLGELLFRIGCGAHFKDWQIAEGGSEGPRKLQAYKPPSDEVAARWRREAALELQRFLDGPPPTSATLRAARERASALLPLLS